MFYSYVSLSGSMWPTSHCHGIRPASVLEDQHVKLRSKSHTPWLVLFIPPFPGPQQRWHLWIAYEADHVMLSSVIPDPCWKCYAPMVSASVSTWSSDQLASWAKPFDSALKDITVPLPWVLPEPARRVVRWHSLQGTWFLISPKLKEHKIVWNVERERTSWA